MTALRLLLNAGHSGANAFFALAQARGFFQQAGLEPEFTPGRGAYTAAPRLLSEGFDAAYGDLNALIEMAAQSPLGELPIAVLVAHQHAPTCITVARAGPIHGPSDLAGRRIVGHANDVALRTFAGYAHSAALAPGSVRIETSEAGMAELLSRMLDGEVDGVFGYMTTHTAALAGLAQHTVDSVRFLPYREVCSAFYGSALMVSPTLIREQPQTVGRLVAAVRAGILAAQAQPQAAIDAVMALNPQADRRVEMQRWLGTLTGDIGWPTAYPGLWPGLGQAANQRLDASIECLSTALGWAHRPDTQRVFSSRFLAPDVQPLARDGMRA